MSMRTIYSKCKDFVNICEQDKDLTEIIFSLDDANNLKDVLDVDSSKYSLDEMADYLIKMQEGAFEIEDYFNNSLMDKIIDAQISRQEHFDEQSAMLRKISKAMSKREDMIKFFEFMGWEDE